MQKGFQKTISVIVDITKKSKLPEGISSIQVPVYDWCQKDVYAILMLGATVAHEIKAYFETLCCDDCCFYITGANTSTMHT